jgi:hypothetical protein
VLIRQALEYGAALSHQGAEALVHPKVANNLKVALTCGHQPDEHSIELVRPRCGQGENPGAPSFETTAFRGDGSEAVKIVRRGSVQRIIEFANGIHAEVRDLQGIETTYDRTRPSPHRDPSDLCRLRDNEF